MLGKFDGESAAKSHPGDDGGFPADLGDRGLYELAVLFSGQRVEFAGTAGSNYGAERVANHLGYVGAATVNVEGKVGFEVGDREGDHASQPAA